MMAAGLVSPEASVFGLQTAAFSHRLPSLCLCTPRVSSSDYVGTSHVRLGHCLYAFMPFLNFNYPFKGPISKYSHLGVTASTHAFRVNRRTTTLVLLPAPGPLFMLCCLLRGVSSGWCGQLFLTMQHLV